MTDQITIEIEGNIMQKSAKLKRVDNSWIVGYEDGTISIVSDVILADSAADLLSDKIRVVYHKPARELYIPVFGGPPLVIDIKKCCIGPYSIKCGFNQEHFIWAVAE